ncbi:MAG: hypothetical protein E5V56_01230 [Mesorhizobium sp.]|nr:MAG: hypothetical protein E5V56_01230 [Mesorhizobium sp.]
MANGAPLSIRGAKAILNSLAEGSQDSAKSLLKAHIVAAFDSHDYVEGRAAFSERRKPVFRGL